MTSGIGFLLNAVQLKHGTIVEDLSEEILQQDPELDQQGSPATISGFILVLPGISSLLLVNGRLFAMTVVMYYLVFIFFIFSRYTLQMRGKRFPDELLRTIVGLNAIWLLLGTLTWFIQDRNDNDSGPLFFFISWVITGVSTFRTNRKLIQSKLGQEVKKGKFSLVSELSIYIFATAVLFWISLFFIILFLEIF